jgi:uncharacterized protein
MYYIRFMHAPDFEWDDRKNLDNIIKHGVSFHDAQRAFLDEHRIIFEDPRHSNSELRYFCLGKMRGKIMTVRFTYRDGKIRIFGAGYWRKGKKAYEKENAIHE